MWTQIATQISESRGVPFQIIERRSVGGGCINQSYIIGDPQRLRGDDPDLYFIKLNQPQLQEMFAAEAAGLSAMAQTQSIQVPHPICHGVTSSHAYLVLSYLELGGSNTARWQRLGQELAALHQAPATTPGFGWYCHNYIGSTPQINTWHHDWAQFFLERRLGYQFKCAGNHLFPQGQQLLAAIPALLNHQPPVSLVHGDLWSGNAGFTRDGEPVIFDPATYYGDREVDLAMTELFGGFPAAFYQGYQEVYPLAIGYEQRKVIYNLYHVLNHYNLFGGSYLSQANNMINQILRWS